MEKIDEIQTLKKSKKVLIVSSTNSSHEVLRISDFSGDPLQLARFVETKDFSTVLVVGPSYFANIVKVFNPKKSILIPRIEMVCPMTKAIPYDWVKNIKGEGNVVVSLLQAGIEIMSLSDFIVSDTKILDVVRSIEAKTIYVLPDKNVAQYVQKNFPDKEIKSFCAFCIPDSIFLPFMVDEKKSKFKGAEVVVTPYTPVDVIEKADRVIGRDDLIKYVLSSDKKEFIVGHEVNLINRLKRDIPSKFLYPLYEYAFCPITTMATLSDIVSSLRERVYEINIPENTANRIRKIIEESEAYGEKD